MEDSCPLCDSRSSILYPRPARDYGSGSSGGLTDGGVVTGTAGVGAGMGFTTGMNGGFEAAEFEAGSRLDGGRARSTTVISPAAWARYSATSIGRCFFSTRAR